MNKLANVICLSAPSVGIILNSECSSKEKAKTLLSDRIANGDAFPGEVVKVTSRASYDAAHHTTPLVSVSGIKVMRETGACICAPRNPIGRTTERLTDAELAHLIRQSSNGHLVQLKFGPGWSALEETPSNEWARQELARIRTPEQLSTERSADNHDRSEIF